jgi:C4-dicarboxylate transporter DctM subunit
MTEIVLIFGILLLVLITGLPVFITLGVMGAGYLLLSGQSLASLATVIFGSIDNFVLVALPLFILMAQIMTRGGIGNDLFAFVHTWLRHLPGGLAVTTVVTCAIFAAISGSSTATAVTVGIAAIPPMLEYGYDRKYVLGLVAAGGTLGILIPPSGPLIIYGAITDTSVGKLFIAGIVPGIMVSLIYMAYCFLRALHEKTHQMEPPATWSERWTSLKNAALPLMLPPVIIGGIYTGIFTPTEAAGIGAGASFVICFVIQRRLGIKDVLPILQETVKTSSMLFMIMATAIFFGQVLTVNQVPQNVARWVVEMGMSKWAFLIFVNILLIFLGDFLEVVSIMLITIPIFFPVILELGINPVWFAIIFIINMELALITPPVGLNLYVILGIVQTNIGEVLRGAVPFMLLLALALALVILFPGLCLWLQSFVHF